MFKLAKWFIQNELKGLGQIGKIFLNGIASFGYDYLGREKSQNLSDSNFEQVKEIVQNISENSKVIPDHVNVLLNPFEDKDHALLPSVVNLSLKTINNKNRTEWTFAHELGHIKHRKFHKAINLLNLPYNLAYKATTALYAFGAMAYPFLGNSGINFANNFVGHAAEFLIVSGTLNAITTRVREYQADIFAYKQTGLLPSEHLGHDYRNGIVGNVSGIISNVSSIIISGYPVPLERDIVVKLIGGKPKKNSFVEEILKERKENKQEHRPFI
ncbi:MAG: M48 family metalloprotease [Chitinophagaceae bacterium]